MLRIYQIVIYIFIHPFFSHFIHPKLLYYKTSEVANKNNPNRKEFDLQVDKGGEAFAKIVILPTPVQQKNAFTMWGIFVVERR